MTSGINLTDALKAARRLGCRLTLPRRTGEGRLSHPLVDRSVRFNLRRKDAPRAVTTFLCRVADLLGQPAH